MKEVYYVEYKMQKCPHCEGKGRIKVLKERKTAYAPYLMAEAANMRGLNMSYREIARKLGLSHPQIAKNMARKHLLAIEANAKSL